jgi:hypothetical protein
MVYTFVQILTKIPFTPIPTTIGNYNLFSNMRAPYIQRDDLQYTLDPVPTRIASPSSTFNQFERIFEQ